MSFRVVSWNMRGAGKSSLAWDYLLHELTPDIALLQEVIVRLTQQSRDVWVADLLCATIPKRTADAWIVGGDFNLSETFDRHGPRGNREYLDRMTSAGYTECLRTKAGHAVTTFKPRGPVEHQIDHLFVSAPLAARLLYCTAGPAERVFHDDLSDHLPIIADFAAG